MLTYDQKVDALKAQYRAKTYTNVRLLKMGFPVNQTATNAALALANELMKMGFSESIVHNIALDVYQQVGVQPPAHLRS